MIECQETNPKCMGDNIMISNGYCHEEGACLSISSERDWHIKIRRTDHQPDKRFAHYHGKPVDGRDLKQFIPNWEALDWQPGSSISDTQQMSAIDGEFAVALVMNKDCELSNGQIVKEFNEFIMNHNEYDSR